MSKEITDKTRRELKAFLKPMADRWNETKCWHRNAPDNHGKPFFGGEIHIDTEDLYNAARLYRKI